MSDSEIRAVRQEAAASATALVTQAERNRKEAERERQQRAIQCQDFVYRQRNPYSCNTGLWFGEPVSQLPSADDIFDQMILRRCVGADSVYKARQMNCLP